MRDAPNTRIRFRWGTVVILALALAGVGCWLLLRPHGIQRAASRGDVERVRVLIERGADLNEATSKFGDKLDREMTPVMWAVDGNHAEVIRLLAEAGAVVDRDGLDKNSPVYWAIFWRHDDALKALLAAGADTEVRNEHQGQTPLHMALEGRYVAGVLLLLEFGADPSSVDDQGNKPLPLAAALFREEEFDAVVRALINAGADPDCRIDTAGRTCLMLAVEERRSGLVRFLLDAGASPSVPDDTGATARDYLKRGTSGSADSEILEMLGAS